MTLETIGLHWILDMLLQTTPVLTTLREGHHMDLFWYKISNSYVFENRTLPQ